MIDENELLQTIDAFRAKHNGMPETEFGRLAMNDFSFVEDLRSKCRSPKLKTVKKLVEFMENYNPLEKKK
jgi:hypothetical protein